MKKLIYSPFVILLFSSIIILCLDPEESQAEKITIQTDLYPLQVMEMKKINAPGTMRIIWVQAKNKKAKNISFYANAATLELIIAKVNSTNKKYREGKQMKFTWLIEKNGTTTFLKLIRPSDYKPFVPHYSRC